MPTTALTLLSLFVITLTCCVSSVATGQEPVPMKILETMVGKWEGTCKTWLRPGSEPDESKIAGEFKALEGVKVIRHSYESSFQEEPRNGEETIAYNAPENEFQVSWFDTFHMNYALLLSTGKANEEGNGFTVLSKYRMGPDQDYWSWRTEYEVVDEDTLRVVAYNITPAGQEGKAVDISYKRVK